MKVIIMGATSGIGLEVAKIISQQGHEIGIAGRRSENLERIKGELPNVKATASIDITQTEATKSLQQLIDDLGGVDLYFHSSGIGYQNQALDDTIELNTVRTNCEGMTRMLDYVFNYFVEQKREGQIAVITSVARPRPLIVGL